ncbi:MAG: NAD(P)/FAD-dependent oxidoreductase [Candidatus Nanoarchaeia archaeon]|nr:NAD(P)/FAD-dependent oxidoreductase [Candidatus Nanoarchaeia archaeon]
MKKVSIIGAGPSGSYLACILANHGFEVSVFEEHDKVGFPVQCTGITTSFLKELVELKKEFVINKVSKARIFSTNKDFVDIRIKENFVLDRAKFDHYLMKKAEKQGVKFFLGHRFVGADKNTIRIQKAKSKIIKEIKTDYIVGADGPLSDVARSFKFKNKKEFLYGIQARVKLKNNNIVEFYPYIGEYAWVVPESKEIVRIGVASGKNTKKIFDDFIRERLKENQIMEIQAGLIPVYNPKAKVQKNNVFLLGDAAKMVKATTGGGIIPGILGAKALANSIIKRKDYNTQLKKLVKKELLIHLKARHIMNKFSNKDWDYLIKICNNPKIKKILSENERDFISRILIESIIAEPRLLYFAKFIF